MQALNDFVVLAPEARRHGGLIIQEQLGRFVVKAVGARSQLKPGDQVLAPINVGIEYEDMRIADEKHLMLRFK